MGSILRCPHPVTVGVARHVLYCCHQEQKDGSYIILVEFIPLQHVILLKALLYSHELNTLDAARSWSICGVIIVDAKSFRSIFHGRDAYIHDHCLRYHHKYQISSLQVTVKGLTTPLSRWVQVFVCLCRCYH